MIDVVLLVVIVVLFAVVVAQRVVAQRDFDGMSALTRRILDDNDDLIGVSADELRRSAQELREFDAFLDEVGHPNRPRVQAVLRKWYGAIERRLGQQRATPGVEPSTPVAEPDGNDSP